MMSANSPLNKNYFNTPNNKNFGLFASNCPDAFNLNNNNKSTPNSPNKFLGNQANDLTKYLDLLPKSDFKRGFIKTQENHHYYILNEIQANSYSKSFSAVKYIKNINSANEENNFELCDESFLIKFYPKSLLSEFFTESELLDFEYSLVSKYKSLGLNDKHIQKIFEIIIANDCVLVVTELYENNLKDFLIKNKDICKSSYLTSQLEIKIEWYFGKLIYDLVNKLNELKKKNVFFGALINSNDIYIRNFDLNYNDILQLDATNISVLDDIDFVFTNPFFYEIETLFKLLNNGPIAYIYPPEFMKHFKHDTKRFGFIQIDQGVYIFRSKEEKEFYGDKHQDELIFGEKNVKKLSNIKTVKNESILSKFNSGNLNNFNDEKNINNNENNKLKRISFTSKNINKEKKSGGILSSLLKKKEKNFKEKNNEDFVSTEVYLLVSSDQRVKFDAWMIGMLIFEIIFNKYPSDITKLKDFNEVLEFYFPDSFSNYFKNNLNSNKKKSVKDSSCPIKLGTNLIKIGINNNTNNNNKISYISPKNLNTDENIQEKKHPKKFSFLRSGISNLMKDLLSYCFKIDWKSRVYPNFDDCTDEKIKNLKVNSDIIASEKNIDNENDLSESMGKNYDVQETFEILKGEGRNQYVDFIMRKNEYVKLITERRSEYADTFLYKFFFNKIKLNSDKNEENLKKLDKIYL